MAKARGTSQVNRSGKVGSEVYRQSYAGTIVSQWQAIVKNPRTYAQMVQRAKIAIVSAGYEAMKQICDHSFEGTTYGAQSMNKFKKLNNALVTKWNNRGNKAVANNFQVAAGSIAEVPLGTEQALATTLAEDTTFAQLRDILGGGLQAGDQITFMTVITQKTATSPNGAGDQPAGPIGCYVGRAMIPINITDETVVGNSNTLWEEAGIKLYNLDLTNSYPEVKLPDGVTDAGNIVMQTIILSRKAGGKWLRSNAYLKPYGTGIVDDVWTEMAGVSTYSPNSPYYLNEAEMANA